MEKKLSKEQIKKIIKEGSPRGERLKKVMKNKF